MADKLTLEDKINKAAEYIKNGDPYHDVMDNYDVMDAIELLAKILTGGTTMKITLKPNETDPEMIEMWTYLYEGTPSLMAVVDINNFTGLVEYLDDLDSETVVEMTVIDNE